MTARWQAIVIVVGVLGFLASLRLLPPEPFDELTRNALKDTGAVIENRPAPNFELLERTGQRISLQQLNNNLLYLNFWASWCESCRDEMPSLHTFADEYGERMSVVAVSIDESAADALNFLQRHPAGDRVRILLDPGAEVAHQYGTLAIPETYIIDTSGTILARLVGPQDFTSDSHRRLVEHLLRR
jgi:cytochrome c biogenesis protein CcmG/thiol:disulfide interchange protein DsbE